MKEIKKKKGKRRWTRDDTDLTLISLPIYGLYCFLTFQCLELSLHLKIIN